MFKQVTHNIAWRLRNQETHNDDNGYSCDVSTIIKILFDSGESALAFLQSIEENSDKVSYSDNFTSPYKEVFDVRKSGFIWQDLLYIPSLFAEKVYIHDTEWDDWEDHVIYTKELHDSLVDQWSIKLFHKN